MRIHELVAHKSKFIFSYLFVLLLLIMGARLLQDRSWFLGIFSLISAILIFYVYCIAKKVPLKYLLPGVLLLIFFQIYPAFYSGYVAFTNDSNGHQLSKIQAVNAIIDDSLMPVNEIEPISYVVAKVAATKSLVVIFQYPLGTYWVGNNQVLRQLELSQLELEADGRVKQASGYVIFNSEQSLGFANELQDIRIKIDDSTSLQPVDIDLMEAFQPRFKYSESNDVLTDLKSGQVFSPNDNGQMVSASGEILYPGWKVNVGWRNFSSIISDEEIKRPLLAVLLWTFVNAFLVVILSFLMGLSLALVFNFQYLRSRRFYRTIFIMPMAIPSVLSVLVWAGLFGTETGVIDRLFHISTPWLTDNLWARVAVLIVELWLAFPYMFLICTGAIQAIPNEILEAADIDGASPLKSFRLIKLPLVMRTIAPLLVSSGAMALNNFGAIYLLTGGGPIFSNSNGNAGATDILISYTYKLAFNSQEGNNYGLASALSILNFILVGLISVYGLRKMKTMEGVN